MAVIVSMLHATRKYVTFARVSSGPEQQAANIVINIGTTSRPPAGSATVVTELEASQQGEVLLVALLDVFRVRSQVAVDNDEARIAHLHPHSNASLIARQPPEPRAAGGHLYVTEQRHQAGRD
jgi:hypothetical protein